MRILVLGTGAGENYPSPWCMCKNCTYARVHGGKNIRGNSSILINEDLMIDLTENSVRTASRLGVSLNSLEHLLITHRHSDHFSPNHLWARSYPGRFDKLTTAEIEEKQGAPTVTPLRFLSIYGPQAVQEEIAAATELDASLEQYHARFNAVAGETSFTAGAYHISTLTARHGSFPGYTLNYIIRHGGKTLLYALDTGGYSAETWDFLAAHRFDCVFVEATGGLMPRRGPEERAGHMSLQSVREFIESLRKQQCVSGDTRIFLSHVSPHWTPPHDVLAPMMEKEGIEVAYDEQIIDL
ncbi:hypothetical protein LJC63_05460 [Ruminococcaceae bacterium OttesenSCG-928-L11]|nr:hypothetical protein [Ruminococcaceae bacterium OttesenSCG-928-L11]